jgi:hypothetical protein
MTTRPPHSDDYLIDGVLTPPELCRLVSKGVTEMVRAAYAAYGEVDFRVVAWARAIELAGERYATCANASSADVGNRESCADVSDAGAGPSRSAQFDRDLLNAAEVAKEVGCTPANVRDLVRRGRLVPARCRPYMFTATEAHRLIQSRKSA